MLFRLKRGSLIKLVDYHSLLEIFKRKISPLQVDIQTPEIKAIKSDIHNGKFENALKELEILESKNTLSSDQTYVYYIRILKGHVLNKIGLNDQALKIVEDILIDDHIEPILTLDAQIIKSNILFDLGNLNDSLEIVRKSDKSLKTIKGIERSERMESEASIKYLLGRIYRKKGSLDLAFENLQQALIIRKELGHAIEIADTLNDVGIIYASKGDLDSAVQYLQESLTMYNNLGKTQPKLFNNIGMIYKQKGELDKSLDFFNNGLTVSEKLGNKNISAILLQNIGLIQWLKGELDLALDFFQNSFHTLEELDSKYEMASVLINIGLIYTEKGELDYAIKNYEKSLALSEELGIKPQIAMNYINIGLVYQKKSDYNLSADYYLKSRKLFEETENNEGVWETEINLVQNYVFLSDIDKAREQLEELRKASANNPENKLINLIYRLANAIVLKTSERMIKKAQAQEILQNIVKEEIIKHDLTVEGMLNLCEILLTEIKNTASEEALKELKSLLDQLSTIAKNQNSYSLVIETDLLKSKVAIIEQDPKTAQQLLSNAQITAENKGLQKLSMLISHEYDLLLNQLSNWEDSVFLKTSLSERLELTELETMVKRMIQKSIENIPELQEEEPILLLIVSESGIPVYSKQFLSKEQFNDVLISGLITAINSFVRETFSVTGSIERISHNEYTMLFKPKESFLFCYVIKGQSYLALKKLEKFTKVVTSNDDLWSKITNALDFSEIEADKSIIDELITKTFPSVV